MQEQFRGGQKSCQNRIIGLDLVRSCAILFVIAGHFFVLNTPFKNTDFGGFSMFLQAMSIPLFMTGVPLFLLLTGYLNANKTVSKRYYKGCIRVLASYFLFSLLTILFRKYYLQEDLGKMDFEDIRFFGYTICMVYRDVDRIVPLDTVLEYVV